METDGGEGRTDEPPLAASGLCRLGGGLASTGCTSGETDLRASRCSLHDEDSQQASDRFALKGLARHRRQGNDQSRPGIRGLRGGEPRFPVDGRFSGELTTQKLFSVRLSQLEDGLAAGAG